MKKKTNRNKKTITIVIICVVVIVGLVAGILIGSMNTFKQWNSELLQEDGYKSTLDRLDEHAKGIIEAESMLQDAENRDEELKQIEELK